MNEDELNAIKEYTAKATPGPWAADYVRDGDAYEATKLFKKVVAKNTVICNMLTDFPARTNIGWQETLDAEFIAAARADVPALVAEVERLNLEKRSLFDEIIQAIDQELKWCFAHPDKAFTSDYRKGFTNGLVQATYLIGKIAEIALKDGEE